MPGETGFQVLDANGKPLESQASLSDPDDVIKTVPTAVVVGCVGLGRAGRQPACPADGPATEIDGVAKAN